ncbi:metal ABC transporter substrate-binding protein [Paenibacillus glycanilyticus]|uniref:High-affinity zinc uptake system binding-protein ZnuA n=1 Tax=Paenibacillus glycanilyticus TaxID=126569 RepID=A0ABQ6GLK3_9BACL|nr:metal ABC transporter substrate-binding protein [Paenibacillus glycanilyticus]GLX70960.1 high-affinity zinc uptake system binding-protein ZnuA [Paenibacillus glycanilyticus]
MKSWLKKAVVISAFPALMLSGCGKEDNNSNTAASAVNGSAMPEETAATGEKLQIVATFYPMVEFTKQIAGEHANVIGLIPSGVEPHDWEPSAKDMAAIQDADVFVYNGIVEGWVDTALESAVNPKRNDVEASSGISLMESVEDEHEHEHEQEQGNEEAEEGHSHESTLDPHVWLSPVLAQEEVKTIKEALIKADPAHKADYEIHANAFLAKLQELDKAYRTKLAGASNKTFITQHAAFSYLAKQYGLTQVPIAGLSPEQEPSAEEMAEVVEFAKEHDVSTIFFETLVNPKIAETIATELGAESAVLNPLEGLTEQEIKDGKTYLDIMYSNLEALNKALNK